MHYIINNASVLISNVAQALLAFPDVAVLPLALAYVSAGAQALLAFPDLAVLPLALTYVSAGAQALLAFPDLAVLPLALAYVSTGTQALLAFLGPGLAIVVRPAALPKLVVTHQRSAHSPLSVEL